MDPGDVGQSEAQNLSGSRENSEPDHRKPCTRCSKLCDVRIRCQIDETGKWHLVCPGKCWKVVSGGVIDGSGNEEHQYYRYGGVWKNKHDAVSGRKPKKKVQTSEAVSATNVQWSGSSAKYTKNDRVLYEDEIWICRKSHRSDAEKPPPIDPSLWKESVNFKEEADGDEGENVGEAPT